MIAISAIAARLRAWALRLLEARRSGNIEFDLIDGKGQRHGTGSPAASQIDLTTNAVTSNFVVRVDPQGVAWLGNATALVVNDADDTLVAPWWPAFAASFDTTGTAVAATTLLTTAVPTLSWPMLALLALLLAAAGTFTRRRF